MSLKTRHLIKKKNINTVETKKAAFYIVSSLTGNIVTKKGLRIRIFW